ncbi:MAG: dihydrofolate reductase [Sphingopyxis sp.]|nr:dihydrofolate reductase [Sphingopyxis sp.]
MQGLGGAEEDPRNGFERGGWAIPLVDAEGMKYLDQIYGSADAFLFGRFTYNIFAKSWGAFEGSSTSAIASALNERPKYVVSNTLTEPSWSRTTIISGGVAPAIRDLKQSHEETLVVPGSGKLVRALLALELVDQIDLVIYPIVVGQGERLFPDSGPDMALELINSRTSPSGLTMQSYRTSGRPAYQQATLSTDEMSDIGQDKP